MCKKTLYELYSGSGSGAAKIFEQVETKERFSIEIPADARDFAVRKIIFNFPLKGLQEKLIKNTGIIKKISSIYKNCCNFLSLRNIVIRSHREISSFSYLFRIGNWSFSLICSRFFVLIWKLCCVTFVVRPLSFLRRIRYFVTKHAVKGSICSF